MSTLRLTDVTSLASSTTAPFRLRSAALAAVLVCLAAGPAARAQQVLGRDGTHFHDTSMLTSAEKEAAADHKVRIVEFEDLECPACAAAAPIVKTALEHYKIDFDRHDFLIQSHIWSKNAAIIARYLQDKVSPEVAEEYRRDVFKNQVQIGSRDDLDAFSQKWFTAHKLQMPFNLGPDSVYALEVQSDCNAGVRLGLMHTPTIVVVGPRGWIEVSDVSQLYTAIDMAEKQAPVTAAHNNLKKPVSTNAH